MKIKRILSVMFAFWLLSACWLAQYGYCSEISSQTMEQKSELSNQSQELQSTRELQNERLKMLEEELMNLYSQLQISKASTEAAKQSLSESQTVNSQLSQDSEKLRVQLKLSQDRLTLSQEYTLELHKKLTEQSQQIELLQNRLKELSGSAENAENLMKEADQDLLEAQKEIQAALNEHKKTEKKLREQKILWQILAIGLGAWAITK